MTVLIRFRSEWKILIQLKKIFISDFLVPIDLSDAFLSIPLHSSSKKLVPFQFNNRGYYFNNVLPVGLSSSLKIFCKLLRPVIIHFRSLGTRISAYTDDIFSTLPYQEYQNNTALSFLIFYLHFNSVPTSRNLNCPQLNL